MVHRDSQGYQAGQEIKETWASPDQKDRKDFLDQEDLPVSLEYQGWRESRRRRERKET